MNASTIVRTSDNPSRSGDAVNSSKRWVTRLASWSTRSACDARIAALRAASADRLAHLLQHRADFRLEASGERQSLHGGPNGEDGHRHLRDGDHDDGGGNYAENGFAHIRRC